MECGAPLAIFHSILACFSSCARRFHRGLHAVRPARAAQGQKASGSRRLRRRGGAVQDRHVAAGHERAGVELSRRGLPARRPAGRRRDGVSTRPDARPRPDGGALQSRLPVAGAEQTRRGRKRVYRLHACAAARRRKAGSSSASRNCRRTTSSPAEKSFSTALYLNPNNAEALNGLGLARVERGRPRDAAQFFAAAAKAQSGLRARPC